MPARLAEAEHPGAQLRPSVSSLRSRGQFCALGGPRQRGAGRARWSTLPFAESGMRLDGDERPPEPCGTAGSRRPRGAGPPGRGSVPRLRCPLRCRRRGARTPGVSSRTTATACPGDVGRRGQEHETRSRRARCGTRGSSPAHPHAPRTPAHPRRPHRTRSPTTVHPTRVLRAVRRTRHR